MSMEADYLNIRLNLDSPDARAAVIDLVNNTFEADAYGVVPGEDERRELRALWVEQLVDLVREECRREGGVVMALPRLSKERPWRRVIEIPSFGKGGVAGPARPVVLRIRWHQGQWQMAAACAGRRTAKLRWVRMNGLLWDIWGVDLTGEQLELNGGAAKK